MEKKDELQSMHVQLTKDEYATLKEYAKQNNIPTKTMTEFLLKNIIREAKSFPNPSFLEKIKGLFRPLA